MLDDHDLYHVYKRCKELGALAMMHAENGHMIANVRLKVYFTLTVSDCCTGKM